MCSSLSNLATVNSGGNHVLQLPVLLSCRPPLGPEDLDCLEKRKTSCRPPLGPEDLDCLEKRKTSCRPPLGPEDLDCLEKRKT
ncbi:hypothetical protein INR49_026079 [Caranx melampygus]|nr:hypothetical protein INR49_026079 [Caranx melampygus]